MANEDWSVFPYKPNLPAHIVYATLIAISTGLHVYQNLQVMYSFTANPPSQLTLQPTSSRYKYWRVTFFKFYGGILFMSGWIVRPMSARHTLKLNRDLSH